MDLFLEVICIMSLPYIFTAANNLVGCCTNYCTDYGVDCQDYQARGHTASGVFHVAPSRALYGYDVYCDMTTDGGGWLIFQKRVDGSLDFYRDWREYEKGFGDPSHEYWLGLRRLKAIMTQGFYELRIDLTDFEGNSSYAHYDNFDIGDFTENYRLKVTGYKGTADSLIRHNGLRFSTWDKEIDNSTAYDCAEFYHGAWWYHSCHDSNLNGPYWKGDSLIRHNGLRFSTWDNENDNITAFNCAEYYHGAAWWYNMCHDSNLNGSYWNGTHRLEGVGVNWRTWRGHHYSLKTTDMKIRRAI